MKKSCKICLGIIKNCTHEEDLKNFTPLVVDIPLKKQFRKATKKDFPLSLYGVKLLKRMSEARMKKFLSARKGQVFNILNISYMERPEPNYNEFSVTNGKLYKRNKKNEWVNITKRKEENGTIIK